MMSLRTKIAAACSVAFLVGSRILMSLTYQQELWIGDDWPVINGFKEYGPSFVEMMSFIGVLLLLFAVVSAIYDRHRKQQEPTRINQR